MTYQPPPLGYATPMAYGVALDHQGQVVADLSCRKCGYNLRGLNINGRCPECGTAVGYSAQGDLLRFCDPDWVETLRRGATFIIAGIAVIFLGVIVGIGLGAAIGASGGGLAILPVLMAIIVVVGYALGLIGWWSITTPDPSGLGEDTYGTSRKIIRVALLVGLASQVVDIGEKFSSVPTSLGVVLTLFQIGAGLVGVVGFFAQLQYLKKMALRIPDEAMSSRANFLMWALGISYGVIIVFGGMVALMTPTANTRGAGGAFAGLACIMGIVGIALFVFLIMYLILIEKIGKAFKEQAQIARSTWAIAQRTM
jgi:hypothetical protein